MRFGKVLIIRVCNLQPIFSLSCCLILLFYSAAQDSRCGHENVTEFLALRLEATNAGFLITTVWTNFNQTGQNVAYNVETN